MHWRKRLQYEKFMKELLVNNKILVEEDIIELEVGYTAII